MEPMEPPLDPPLDICAGVTISCSQVLLVLRLHSQGKEYNSLTPRPCRGEGKLLPCSVGMRLVWPGNETNIGNVFSVYQFI